MHNRPVKFGQIPWFPCTVPYKPVQLSISQIPPKTVPWLRDPAGYCPVVSHTSVRRGSRVRPGFVATSISRSAENAPGSCEAPRTDDVRHETRAHVVSWNLMSVVRRQRKRISPTPTCIRSTETGDHFIRIRYNP